jgi:hypothetical protein
MISFSLRLYTYPGKKTRADGATFPWATRYKNNSCQRAYANKRPARSVPPVGLKKEGLGVAA